MKSVNNDILIVDDNPKNLFMLRQILMEQGYKVRPAINGRLALQIAKDAHPDIILLDIKMSEMDGYEVCRRLKADPQTSDIPIVFLSALDDIDAKVTAFETGGVDYITKPFQVPEVLARVKTHLTLEMMRHQLQEHADELARTNAALIREKSVMDIFMATVPDRICFKDVDGRITRANQAYANRFGFSTPDESIGRTDFDVFQENHARIQYQQEQKIIRTGRPLVGLEEEDGEGQWILTTKMPLHNEHGNIVGIFGISRDITELKHTQHALEQTNAEIIHLNNQLHEENRCYSVKSLLLTSPYGDLPEHTNRRIEETWQQTHFLVVLIKLLPLTSQNRPLPIQDLLNRLTERLQNSPAPFPMTHMGIPISSTECALILNTDELACIPDLCESIAVQGQTIARDYGYTVVLGIGKEVATLQELYYSYDTAQQASLNRQNILQPQIMRYSDTRRRVNEQLAYVFPFQEEQHLIGAVVSGKQHEMETRIEDIIDRNNLEESHYQKLLALYEHFLRVAGKILSRVQGETSEELNTLFLKKTREPKPETFWEFRASVFEFFRNLTDAYAKHHRLSHLQTRLFAYIETHYADSNLSLDSLAEAFNLHPKYVSRYFKTQTEINYADYLAMVRIRHAKELLAADTDVTLDDIAERVGLLSRQTFNRIFKRYEGMTPGAYRQCTRAQRESA